MNDQAPAKRKPSNFDQLYPGRFLKAGTLGGVKRTLTIRDADLEELEGEDGKKKKAIISFEETDLSLVACKTNGLCIREMFGPSLADWKGRKVTLFPGVWNGEECIRVWGSPEIPADRKVVIRLPRRKPFEMTLHRVVPGAPQAAEVPPPPPAADDFDAPFPPA